MSGVDGYRSLMGQGALPFIDALGCLRSLMGQGRGSSGYRRLGMPAFSARSLALDGVSWAQGGKVENAVGR